MMLRKQLLVSLLASLVLAAPFDLNLENNDDAALLDASRVIHSAIAATPPPSFSALPTQGDLYYPHTKLKAVDEVEQAPAQSTLKGGRLGGGRAGGGRAGRLSLLLGSRSSTHTTLQTTPDTSKSIPTTRTSSTTNTISRTSTAQAETLTTKKTTSTASAAPETMVSSSSSSTAQSKTLTTKKTTSTASATPETRASSSSSSTRKDESSTSAASSTSSTASPKKTSASSTTAKAEIPTTAKSTSSTATSTLKASGTNSPKAEQSAKTIPSKSNTDYASKTSSDASSTSKTDSSRSLASSTSSTASPKKTSSTSTEKAEPSTFKTSSLTSGTSSTVRTSSSSSTAGAETPKASKTSSLTSDGASTLKTSSSSSAAKSGPTQTGKTSSLTSNTSSTLKTFSSSSTAKTESSSSKTTSVVSSTTSPIKTSSSSRSGTSGGGFATKSTSEVTSSSSSSSRTTSRSSRSTTRSASSTPSSDAGSRGGAKPTPLGPQESGSSLLKTGFSPHITRPKGPTFQIILSGPPDIKANAASVTPNVDIYDVDLFTTDEGAIRALKRLNKTVICYFSAGTYEADRPDSNVFVAADKGAKLAQWPGERWLRLSSTNVRNIMTKRIQLAAKKGCDAIDPDNIDGYGERGGGLGLTKRDSISFVKFLAEAGAQNNLATGLKNGLEVIADVKQYVQFAVNEECIKNRECDKYKDFAKGNSGKPVFHIEYPVTTARTLSDRDLNRWCAENTAAFPANFYTVLKVKKLDGWVQYCNGQTGKTPVKSETSARANGAGGAGGVRGNLFLAGEPEDLTMAMGNQTMQPVL